MTSAMILAAGLGTRLRPLTEELPKPLVWLGDRPMISHVIERLAGGGVARVVMNTHHLAEAFRPEVLASMPLPTRVLHEPVILGTAGGVANAAEALGDGDVVVWNGDILVDLDVSSLLSTHRSSGLAATLVVAPMAVGEGTVGLSASGDVVRLRGERFGEEASGGDFVGVQAMSEDLVDALPDKGCLVGDVYLPLLRCGVRLGSSRALGAWEDVGTVAAYRAANARWLARVYPGSEAFVGAGARVASGVDVAGSVIGSSAVVEGEGALRGCVVWPGARVVAPLSDAVVMSSGRVVRA